MTKNRKNNLHYWEKARYRVRFEKSLIVALMLMTSLFGVSHRFPQRPWKMKPLPKYITVTAEMVPTTRVGGVPRAPNLPQVPIPVEDEYMPEDETIETTELVETMDLPSYEVTEEELPTFEEFLGFRTQPDDRDKAVSGVVTLSLLVNVFGQVDSVLVLGNTTRSKTFEEDAIFTAYRTRYRLYNEEAVWIERSFNYTVE